MVEYVIELMDGDQVFALLHIERDGNRSVMDPTPSGYAHVRKFRVKARAQKIAATAPMTRVVPTYGGYVYGSKSSVMPLQSKTNRRPAYRSI